MLISPTCGTEWDCGIVACQFFVGLHGIPWRLSLGEAAEVGGSTPGAGTPHDGILRLLACHGLDCSAAVLGSIEDARIPSIVNYQSDGDGHYGVMVAKSARNVFIFDPTDGEIKSFEFAAFDRVFYSSRYGAHWAAARKAAPRRPRKMWQKSS